jgi:LemA protein
MGYNNAREVFPNNLVASTFDFQAMKLLEIENVAMREAPKLSFR